MNKQIDILNFDRSELELELKESLGLPAFRARQLIGWLHHKRETCFSEMTDITKSLREELSLRYKISRPKVDAVLNSSDGTTKFLFLLPDGAKIETVLIKQPKRYTLCVSSQVGCAIGCTFCRTGLMGLSRNLSSSEIVSQVLAVQDYIYKENTEHDGFRNIVFMGMGEPLHNYENVARAVRLLNDDLGASFSTRKITVSTSGLVPAIKRFGEEQVPANLAVSLNATDDEVRNKIMPINKRWPLKDLLATLRDFPLKNRQRITFEYVLFRGVNDRTEDLARLPNLIKDIPAKVNLIPYNENTGLGFKAPSKGTISLWQDTLLDKGINATIRWSKGDDISAACGQLATKDSI